MKPFNLIKDIIEKRGRSRGYWVACGGSLIDLLPAHMLLEREARHIVSGAYTAREFCITAPKRLGEHSLVVACSHSGNTPEVLDACHLACERGAEVVALTDGAESKIAQGAWTCWVYPWGADVPRERGALGYSRLFLPPSCSISRRASPYFPTSTGVSIRWMRCCPRRARR